MKRKNALKMERRVCACGCGKTFQVASSRTKRFFDASHASRHNAKELRGVVRHKSHRGTCGIVTSKGVARFAGIDAI